MKQTNDESPAPDPDSRVDAIRERVRAAEQLGRRIGNAITAGTSPLDEIAQLEKLVQLLIAEKSNTPPELKDAIRELIEMLRTAEFHGGDWLRNVAGPELDQLSREQRGRNAYRDHIT